MTSETDYGPAWEELISAISAAWPSETPVWSETPLELVTRLIDERDSLRKLAVELWRARRNLAFGPAGEAAVLREFPWLGENRFVFPSVFVSPG